MIIVIITISVEEPVKIEYVPERTGTTVTTTLPKRTRTTTTSRSCD